MTTPKTICEHKALHQYLSNQTAFTGQVLLTQENQTLIKAPYGQTTPLNAPQCIGPITKSFMGALCHKLHENKTLNLDTPLSHYLPDAANRFLHLATCTPRHLLTHTSGLIDFADDSTFFSQDLLQYPHTTAALFPAICRRPSLFTPGEAYHRSRLGYLVLTHLLQHLTAYTLSQLMEQHIYNPLQLKETQCPTEGSPLSPTDWDTSVKVGWGNMSSTLEDLNQWLNAIDTHQFAPFQTTEIRRHKAPKDAVHTGLGWQKLPLCDHISYVNTRTPQNNTPLALIITSSHIQLILLPHPGIEKGPKKTLWTFTQSLIYRI